ncbi:hypothetical protein [Aromatoleum petrolei]|uniref:Uncharacterized protein n=1 Tax=Aromatoleum petrolei TaxID=76116 RepID=A0ABX1MSQ2_9RHOO|nr:hypothetical protein [Aromatoleum petrolei]NMF90992.1 hypothetical protein [Aromatoleum petrolei]QTQ36750.1 Uncharacterized protein ToN1_26100 [Aromatoleum petrolei]
MANESVSVSGPVSVVSDAKQRVAFDLMKFIGEKCYATDRGAQETKDYWLKLYRQCYKAANGGSVESILKEE